MSRTTPERGHARGLRGTGRHLPYKPAADRQRYRLAPHKGECRQIRHLTPTPIHDSLDALLCGHASVMHARRALNGAEAHGAALMAALGLATDGRA